MEWPLMASASPLQPSRPRTKQIFGGKRQVHPLRLVIGVRAAASEAAPNRQGQIGGGCVMTARAEGQGHLTNRGMKFLAVVGAIFLVLWLNASHNSTPPRQLDEQVGNKASPPRPQAWPSTREQIASYAQQMISAMGMLSEGSSGLESGCHDFAFATCLRSFDHLVYKVEDARRIIAVARANEPSCMSEAGAATSRFVDRYYYDLLNVQSSMRAGDAAGTIANAEKATADVSNTTPVKAALGRARIACQASY